MSNISQRLLSLSPEKKALLARELKKKGNQFNFFPLSFAQQRLWLLDQLEPGNPSYNISTAIRFAGHLHVAAFERSLRIVVQRHESLRTTFAMLQGQPVQMVSSSLRVALPLIDLSGLGAAEREPEMQYQADREALYSFDLTKGPLLRTKLFRASETEHVVLLNIHHIVADGWSMTVLLRELAAIYTETLAGQPASLPPLPIQYADYAVWQRKWLQGEVLEEHVAYWRQRLGVGSGDEKRLPGILDLPTDRPRPAVQTYRGNIETLTLTPSLSQRLRDVSRKEGVTLFMTLLAIFQILLYRYTGQEDLVVGAPIANRNRAEIEGLIGFFVNSLVLRTDLSGNPSFHDLLMRVREVALGAYAHQDLSFDKLVEELSPERNLSHTPLFQVYFNMINLPAYPTTWPELTVNIFAPREAGSKFDLTLYATDGDEGILLELLYNTDLFDQARMIAMLQQFAHLASQVLDVEEKIAHFSLVTATEQAILPNPTALLSDRWVGSVQSLFAHYARRTPHSLAVMDASESITYQELDICSNRLARYLQSSGIARGDVVAIYAHRSAPLVAAVFSVLKAGAACLILDPAYPPARLIEYLTRVQFRGWLHIQAAGALPAELEEFLSSSACRCCFELPQRVTDLHAVLAHSSPLSLDIEVGPDDLAFITFTSGSTGKPKGILQRHGSLSHFLPWQQQRFGLQEGERYSMLSGLAHDPLQREIFTPLCLGGTICIPSPEQMGAPGWLARWMQRQAITIAQLTPAMMQLLTQALSDISVPTMTLPTLRCAFTVGDALTRRDVSRLYALAPSVICFNCYGSTETHRALGYYVIPRMESLASQSAQAPRSSKEIIPLGQGIEDTQLLLLTAARQLVGVSELGEIYVRSPHLAAGYLNDAALTQERFITNPFTNIAGDRLYRTGDLGRYRPDGNVEYAGRNDQQVKLRGFRIELAEIEAVLGLHPAVREAAVIVREDTPEQKRLVAYIVPTPSNSIVPNVGAPFMAPAPVGRPYDLRDFLAARLPAYMLPVAFVPLDALPLTPNRKVDRRALPMPESVLSAPETTIVPRTAAEEILTGIWARMLGREQVGVDDNFFDLGGHSLLATQLVARIYEAFRQETPLRALFEAPTVARLAAYLEQHRTDATMQKRQEIVPLPREQYRVENSIYLFPLSFAQERLWFLDQLDPGSVAYTILVEFSVQGKLVVKALQQSMEALVQRHEILRTTFVTLQGRPMQAIAPSLDIPLAVLDLSGLQADERQAQVRQRLQDEAQRSFDLERGPLFALTLLRLSPEEHLFWLSIHHSNSDAWSIDVLFRELNVLYTSYCQGKLPVLAELPIQYGDYAVWQRQWLQGDVLDQQLGYWKAQLAHAPAVLELPTDHVRPALQSYHGARSSLKLPIPLTEMLAQVSRQHDVTLYMTLLAAFQTLLCRYTGQRDILIGTPLASRTSVEVESLIGLFINTLVMRGDLSGNPRFNELLKRVREVALDAYAHQELPFEKLVEELQPERNVSYSPLFQVMFILQNTPTQALQLADLALTPLEAARVAAQYDLTLVLWQEDESLQGYFEYNTDLFDATTIERMAGHLCTLLEGIVSDPSQRIAHLPVLSAAERQQMLVEWNATASPYPLTHGVHTLFEEQAARSSDAMAVVDGDGALSYGELNRRATALSHYLHQRGVGRGSLVALCVERCVEMVVALLGILKAGAAYVPLDPTYPKERLAFMLADAQASLVLTQQHWLPSLPETSVPVVVVDADWGEMAREPGDNLAGNDSSEDLAYVIYTSGSTGQPKGVQITHRALVNFLAAMRVQPGFQGQDTWLAVTSLSFDIAGLELYLPLLTGGRVLLASQEVTRDGRRLADLLMTGAASVMQATPATWRLLLEAGWQGNAQLRILCGGEAFPADLARQLLAKGAALWNLYGPTETTIWSLAQQVQSVERVVPIGRPIANTQVYVLDRQCQPVPIGVPGDLYIGGAGLARGYLHRPDLTAERFLPDPFSREPGMRLYQTGDQVRYLADGTIEFLGRTDQQVKLRGYRIELGEIEAALAQHPTVRQSVAVLREGEGGEHHLVAYVVPKVGAPFMAPNGGGRHEWRPYLARKLPEYMLPSTVVYLPTLPLTPNGKVDRKALPAPEQALPELTGTRLRTLVEELLAQIWGQVLRLEHVGLNDNFFEAGGHSLLATQLLARIRDIFQVEVPLRSLFLYPTVADLAQQIEAARTAHRQNNFPTLTPLGRNEPLPLSFAQQRLWFLDQLESGSSSYNIPIAVRVSGNLNVAALQRSFDELVSRHEALRTTFMIQEEHPLQVIHPPFAVPLPLIDLQEVTKIGPAAYMSGAREKLIRNLVEAHAQRAFDLNRGPLFRVLLLRVSAGERNRSNLADNRHTVQGLSGEEHILLLVMHHIVSDAWSVDVLLHELDLHYTTFVAGRPSTLSDLPIQYADYAVWQRQMLQGEVLEQQIAYWKAQLGNAPAVLALPTDRPRPHVQTYQGAHYPLQLSASLSSELDLLSRAQGVTLYMTLLAAFQTLLSRYTGQHDILVGTPIAGRTSVELEGLIGFFVNTLVMRSDLSGNPRFNELLKRVREVALDAYAHQELPFEKLVEELQPERNISYSPLFQVMLILQNTPTQALQLADLALTPLQTAWVTAKFDLTLTLWQEEGTLQGHFEYNTDLFDATTIERMAGHLCTLLEGIVSDPSQRIAHLPVLSAAERQQMLVEWNATASPYPLTHGVHTLFEEQAARSSDAMAVVDGDGALSYGELNRRATALSHYLHQRGVGRGNLVALCVERCVEMVVALLGILKAGAAYVPLDPTYPKERLAFMLADAQASLVLTQPHLLSSLPETSVPVVVVDADWGEMAREPGDNLAGNASSEDLAYVIYTSGSTGQPKGVLATHRATLNRLHWMWDRFPFAADEVCCQKTSLSFVDSIWEIFGPLLHGISTVILSDAIVKDPPRLVATLAEQGITRIVLVPSLLQAVLDTSLDLAARLARVKYWISSGEALAVELAERFLKQIPESLLINLYGSSEVAADATCYLVNGAAGLTSIPIGRPLANTQVYLLDAQWQPVPIGVPGEIYIGGAGLARGYLHRPELTAEKFIPHAFSQQPGARLYKTGDLARYLPDGTIQYLGRSDRQVKLRGYRIEAQEIEAVLVQHPAVRQAVVALCEEKIGHGNNGTSDKRLVAYIVSRIEPTHAHNGDQALTVGGLRAFLRGKLPEYMLPSAMAHVPALPLTPNGKIDWQALPAPEQAGLEFVESDGASRPPTPVEEVLMGIWADVLGRERVGVFDNFFELGGHSLLATQVIARVRALFQVDLSVLVLFESPTVAGFAEALIEDESVPGQFTAIANVRLKLKRMSAEEVRAQLKQAKKSRR